MNRNTWNHAIAQIFRCLNFLYFALIAGSLSAFGDHEHGHDRQHKPIEQHKRRAYRTAHAAP
jgi:hypothetical protein